MIERLLENWLIRANERSFQIPFCHSLAYEGHTIIQLSRHCAMEMGKDILTIGPDGVACAYQLKGVDGGGKLSLKSWRDDLGKQLYSLALGKIVHPSIPDGKPHKAYIVVNGDLAEEVSREIDDFNRSLAETGIDRKVNVIVRGELFTRFKDLQSDFWATNLGDLKTYLELYLDDGRGQLPKEKIAALFGSSLPLDEGHDKAPSPRELGKMIAGTAIICASSISSFTKAENHVAEFEAWTMYWGYVLATAERWGVSSRQIRFATDLALEAMYSALGRLCDEMMMRKDYSEGDVLSDRPIYEVRMTHLLGLLGIYGLWRSKRILDRVEQDEDSRSQFLRRFCLDRSKSLWLWGEYAIPQFLAYNFFRRTFDPSPTTDFLYFALMQGVVNMNKPGGGTLANPYYDAEDYLPYLLRLEPEPLEDSFSGSSYYLEGLLHLFVRANYKQHVRSIMPSVTRISMRHYAFRKPWKYYLYRDEDGENHDRFMQPPHKWCNLRIQAEENQGEELPSLIKENPIAYLSFLTVCPHRVNASGLRWLSSRLIETC